MCSSSPEYSPGERTSTSGLPEVGQHVVLERADRRVVALDDGVVGHRLGLGTSRVSVAALGDPLGAAAVEQPHVLVAEQA